MIHHHADHTGGIAALVNHFGEVPISGPMNSPYKVISNCIKENALVSVLGVGFMVLEIPGHTLDHIAYYNAQQGLLFCGDTWLWASV